MQEISNTTRVIRKLFRECVDPNLSNCEESSSNNMLPL